ncbi:putative fluoride ion transporter CrcB [uncultured Paludibacter sp.]|nr:putative fluoride ion transporter CrcB [uncultured Paludibacter sp.]
MKQILLVGIGGFFGSIARYLVSKLNITWSFHDIPMGTLTVNLLGSFIIGIFLGVFLKSEAPFENLKLLLVVGFCGGFTTFSSFTNENFMLLQNGQYLTALLYIIGSIILGIFFVYLGYLITNLF